MKKKSDDEIFRARQAQEGKKGGTATLNIHGKAFYSKIAKERWKNVKKNGPKKT